MERPKVASFTDAWIETTPYEQKIVQMMSHLLQMRGLKPLMIEEGQPPFVASFTDAWIETISI